VSVEEYTNEVPPPAEPTIVTAAEDVSVEEYTNEVPPPSTTPDTSVEEYSNTVDPSTLEETVIVSETVASSTAAASAPAPTVTDTDTTAAVAPEIITMPEEKAVVLDTKPTMPNSPGSMQDPPEGVEDELVLEKQTRKGFCGCTRLLCLLCSIIFLGIFFGILTGVEKTGFRSWASEIGGPEPTESPTAKGPSMYPSVSPSLMPSDGPSLTPSDQPSLEPSLQPSAEPSLGPTPVPTRAYYPANPEPSNPPNTYFNYNPDSDYGPPRWNRVNTGGHWVSWGKVRMP